MEYDAEGNTTRKYKAGFEQRLVWNDLGQLASVTTNGDTVTYGYTPSGKRFRRTQGGVTRYYIYDGDDLLMELDQSGNPLRRYTHLPGVDRPLSVRETIAGTDRVYYFALEQPGHVAALMNSTGTIVAGYDYAPFGTETAINDGQPLRFMGRELDFSTGLHYVRARWYDAALARFISEDPIGLNGGFNTYAYAGNDPVNQRDPSGLGPECPAWTVCEPLWDSFWWESGPFSRWAEDRHIQDSFSPGQFYGFGGRGGGSLNESVPGEVRAQKQQASREAVQCFANAIEVDAQFGAFQSVDQQYGVIGGSFTSDALSGHITLNNGKLQRTITSGVYGDVTLLGWQVDLGYRNTYNLETGKTERLRGFGTPQFTVPLGGGGGYLVGGSAKFNAGSWFMCWLGAGAP
jgi:RHS repeat-associated protein